VSWPWTVVCVANELDIAHAQLLDFDAVLVKHQRMVMSPLYKDDARQSKSPTFMLILSSLIKDATQLLNLL
jgi:hypothetical protein